MANTINSFMLHFSKLFFAAVFVFSVFDSFYGEYKVMKSAVYKKNVYSN